MQKRLRIAGALLAHAALVGACGSGALETDLGTGLFGDLAKGGDAAGNDFAPAPDFANGADFATPSDLANGPDLSSPRDLAVPPDLTLLAMDMTSGYPAGPYGSNVGDTIAPLQWEGYVNPTAMGLADKQPYGAYSMNDLRRSGAKFALLYAADYW